ncbi:hypothetical protein ACFL6I_15095 [candidate division KSB1 bacterium]
MPEKPDIIISIQTGKHENPDNKPFRATYVSGNEKSEKLACIMGNRFRGDYTVLESSAVDFRMIPKDDYRKVLSRTKPSVVLEIGNINNPDNFDQNSDTNEIASMILNGLDDFYSGKEPSLEAEQEDTDETKTGAGQPTQKGKMKVITR